MAKEPAKRRRAVARPPKGAKKRPPKKAGAQAFAKPQLSDVEVPKPEDMQSSHEALRHEAGVKFVFDANRQTIDWWWKNHYQAVGKTTFYNWSRLDSWRDRREAYWAQITAAVARDVMTEVVEAQVSEVKELADVRKNVMASLLGSNDANGDPIPIPPPKSYESLISAVVRLDSRIDDKRKAVVATLPVALNDQSTEDIGEIGTGFTKEQLRAMARAALVADSDGEAE